jgi:hypothetical protein
MEKGLKNLNHAYRSAQKKQGTYEEDHMDSGIGHSDLDEEHEERLPSVTLSDIPETPFPYQPTYSAAQQRVPSIQNMLQYSGPNPHLRH